MTEEKLLYYIALVNSIDPQLLQSTLIYIRAAAMQWMYAGMVFGVLVVFSLVLEAKIHDEYEARWIGVFLAAVFFIISAACFIASVGRFNAPITYAIQYILRQAQLM